MKQIFTIGLLVCCAFFSFAQKKIMLDKQTFELHNVTGSIIKFEGQNVLKIERDLNAIPFDSNIRDN